MDAENIPPHEERSLTDAYFEFPFSSTLFFYPFCLSFNPIFHNQTETSPPPPPAHCREARLDETRRHAAHTDSNAAAPWPRRSPFGRRGRSFIISYLRWTWPWHDKHKTVTTGQQKAPPRTVAFQLRRFIRRFMAPSESAACDSAPPRPLLSSRLQDRAARAGVQEQLQRRRINPAGEFPRDILRLEERPVR